MSKYEFQAPDFVNFNSPEEIQERMMNELPADIDNMPGGFPYDFTMPTAIEISRFTEFIIVRTLMLMFPDWATDYFLDLHAAGAGIARKAATAASGTVTFTGTLGTTIPAGTLVCTAATDDTSSLLYATDSTVVIPESGTVDATVTSVETGSAVNTAAKTVIFFYKPVNGVDTVTNAEAITGGTDAETDESLQARIDEANASEASFIANDSDYRRWAEEIDGIGDCIVVPAWNGPGTVKLVLVDSNGDPANSKLVQAVYNHIVSPDDRSRRLLPTGSAELTVVAATSRKVSYTCTGLKYDSTTSLEQIISDFKVLAKAEYSEAKTTGRNVLYYNQMRGHITEITGVIDFDTFLMDGKTENITLTAEEYAATDTVTFS